ncbi:hypothetical protein Ancab_032242 [Ancistrocladus abbreviatus]
MEEQESSPSTSTSASSSSSLSSSSVSEERPSTSLSSSIDGPSTASEGGDGEARQEENNGEPVVELILQQTSVSYRSDYSPLWRRRRRRRLRGLADESSNFFREETLYCVVVILTFWLFVSLTLIFGIYGSDMIQLAPYSSIMLQPTPLFVQYIKVEKSDRSMVSPVLYGFHKRPQLNVTKMWSQRVNASINMNTYKEWLYFLNEGSQVNISYNVASSSSMSLIIAQELAEWLQDPSYPNTTLSWNVIHGKGMIRQDISQSSEYYVAMRNLNLEDVEVQLNIQIRSSIYDTTDAYYKCNLTHRICSMKILFPRGNAAILTSPGPQQDTQDQKWYVDVSYEPRWITYFLGIGGMTLLMLFAFNFMNKLWCNNINGNRTEGQAGELEPERAPLLSPKDDDVQSWGSSYDSASGDDEETREHLGEGLSEGKHMGDAENSSTARQLCVICFDAPKDCFFLPCGHCATCFTCGTRCYRLQHDLYIWNFEEK